MSRIILPMREFRTKVPMNSPLGKKHSLEWRNPYEYPKEILDCNAHIHHHHMVLSSISHMDCIYLIQ